MFSANNLLQSWGRYPQVAASHVIPIFWRDELPNLAQLELPVLPYGCGRSYGDSCLNENGILLDMSHLTRFLSFDVDKGLLRCEAGVMLADILALIVPHGWFLSVTPGTKFVSVGGAIANDVHGKIITKLAHLVVTSPALSFCARMVDGCCALPKRTRTYSVRPLVVSA